MKCTVFEKLSAFNSIVRYVITYLLNYESQCTFKDLVILTKKHVYLAPLYTMNEFKNTKWAGLSPHHHFQPIRCLASIYKPYVIKCVYYLSSYL